MTNEPVISSSNVKDIIRGLQEQTIQYIYLGSEIINEEDLKEIKSGIETCKTLHSLELSDSEHQIDVLHSLCENTYVTDLMLDLKSCYISFIIIQQFIEKNKSLLKLHIDIRSDKLFLSESLHLINITKQSNKRLKLSLKEYPECLDKSFGSQELKIMFLKDLQSNFALCQLDWTIAMLNAKGKIENISLIDDKVKVLLDRNRKLWALLELGQELSQKGEYKKAIPHFDVVIQLAPEFPQAWLEKAKALYNTSDFSLESLKVAQKAMQLNPNNEDTQKFYKQVLLGLKRIEAIKIVEQVVNAKNFPRAVEIQLEKWRMVLHSLLVQNDNFSSIVSEPRRYLFLINSLIFKLEEIINKKYAKLETTAQLIIPRVEVVCEEVVVMKVEEASRENIKLDKQEEVEGDKADENKQLSPKASKQFHKEREKLFNSSSQLDGALEQKKKQFSERLQQVFIKAYTAATVINNNDAEIKKDNTDKGLDYVDQANYVTGSIVGVEGTLLIKGITASIRGYRNFTAKEIAYHISQLANDPAEMQKLMQEIGDEVADRYEQQIAMLTSAGITTLVECTALRMIQYVGSNEGVNSNVAKRSLYWMWENAVYVAQGAVRKVSKSFAPDQEPLKKPAKERLLKGVISGKSNIDNTKLQTEKGVTDPDDPWFAAWVLARTGIITEEGEHFSDADCKPKKYGYRKGTKQEAVDLKYTQDKEIENQQHIDTFTN